VAPKPDPRDLHVDTGDLSDYSRQIYAESVSFSESPLAKPDFAGDAAQQTAAHQQVADSFIGPVTSGMGAGMDFWKEHAGRVTEMGQFTIGLGEGLQAIAAASGAITAAYDSSDEVNADRIRDQSGFFRQPTDQGPDTLEGQRPRGNG